MVKIRLKRIGAKKRPVYRLVVADSRSPRDGRFIEAVGFYDPLPDPARLEVDEARVREWLARGARPSDSARFLLERQGILPRSARPVPADTRQPGAESAAPAEAAPVAAKAATATDTAAPVAGGTAAEAEESDTASAEAAAETEEAGVARSEPAAEAGEAVDASAEPAAGAGEAADASAEPAAEAEQPAVAGAEAADG